MYWKRSTVEMSEIHIVLLQHHISIYAAGYMLGMLYAKTLERKVKDA